MIGGEIVIPADLPSMCIVDLAHIIAPKARLVFTGIRPGEKLHESLISPHEIPRTYRFGNSYTVIPESSPLGQAYGVRKVEPDFEYISETAVRLPDEDAIQMIGALPEAQEWRKDRLW
jgi:UDP-N-acetylglucosamine 4,6-dehydratase